VAAIGEELEKLPADLIGLHDGLRAPDALPASPVLYPSREGRDSEEAEGQHLICVYRGTGPADAWLIRDWLVHHGVRAEVRDFLSPARGEVPIWETWPTVWVRPDETEAAEDALGAWRLQLVRPAWTCTRCKEPNEPAFDWCWSCENPRPEEVPEVL
jgi:hypothetical protein